MADKKPDYYKQILEIVSKEGKRPIPIGIILRKLSNKEAGVDKNVFFKNIQSLINSAQLVKLRNGKYDAEQYERLYSLFAKVNEKIVEKDDILADTMCYYTEFVSKLVLHLKTAENPQLPEITADLTGLFGSK